MRKGVRGERERGNEGQREERQTEDGRRGKM